VNYTYDKGFCIAFGKKLRELRKSRGITMKQLALDAEVEYSQIARIELGQSNPTISTVYALSKALEILPQELFSFQYPMPKISRK